MPNVVLFSGGQDSTTCLLLELARLIQKNELGRKGEPFCAAEHVVALHMHYGQRHEVEHRAVQKICNMLGVSNYEVNAGAVFQQVSSAMLASGPLPERCVTPKDLPVGVANTFVPGRNLAFLAMAVPFAVALSAEHIIIGVSGEDNSGYPDCRKEFVNSMAHTIHLALDTSAYVGLKTPLIDKNKMQTVQLAWSCRQVLAPVYGADIIERVLAASHTCYNGARPACGECAACVLRSRGFAQAGVQDPLTQDPLTQE